MKKNFLPEGCHSNSKIKCKNKVKSTISSQIHDKILSIFCSIKFMTNTEQIKLTCLYEKLLIVLLLNDKSIWIEAVVAHIYERK